MSEREGAFGMYAPPARSSQLQQNTKITAETTRLRRKLAARHKKAQAKNEIQQQQKLWQTRVENDKRQLKLAEQKKMMEVRHTKKDV